MDVFVDIETAPDLSAGAKLRYIENVRPPGQYSKPESIAKWMGENAMAIGLENWQRTALDPMLGTVYVFGFSIQGAAPITMFRQMDESEGALLDLAFSAIAEAVNKVGQMRPVRLIGWNHRGFDLPFLAKRCVINGIIPAFKLPLRSRYNDDFCLDLMNEWAGFREYAKQSDVAKAMGIAVPSEIDGKDLWAFVEKNGVEAAAAKCRSDIGVLMEIYQRMSPVFRI